MRAIEWSRRNRRDLVWSAAAALAFVLLTSDAVLTDVFEGLEPSDLVQIVLVAASLLAVAWGVRRRRQTMEAQARAAERQEQLINDVSHELRTPVTIARGHLELLFDSETPLPEVDVALDELSRIERIVERLLLLAKTDQPEFVVGMEVDLEDFLGDVVIRWAGIAPRAWTLGPVPAGTVTLDPGAIRIVLDALLENAVRYTEPMDAIELRASHDGTDAVIEIADRGCGIDPASMDRIFERFARADAARGRDDGGAGLGLAIVEAIAKAHGGRCTVRSSGGETVFALLIPGFRPARSTESEQGVVAETSAAKSPSLGT